ncbi:MAG: sulfite exporter TauE/SafE family protein [Candidatus Thermoplasmatota archaeon]|nr:sulfite exporter TauE/SafE family protein [Candidatus Thermoplasmatota archaeon]
MILLILLFIGVVQGFTFCNFSCGPLLFLRLAGRGKGVKQDLRVTLLFSMPRIVVLTFFGGILGALGYTIDSISDVSSFPWFRAFGYLLLSLIMLSTGLVFLGILGSRNCRVGHGFKNRLLLYLLKLGPRKKGKEEGRFMLIVGTLISMVCFVEVSGLSALVASFMGVDTVSVGGGAFWGAMSLFIYSIGLSIPLVLFATGASFIGKLMKRSDVRAAGGMVLMLLGTLTMIFSIYSFIKLAL